MLSRKEPEIRPTQNFGINIELVELQHPKWRLFVTPYQHILHKVWASPYATQSHSVSQVNKQNGDVSGRRQRKTFTANQKRKKHIDFQVRESGLVINPLWPSFGASPDGIISCKCCGRGTLEIKCPYSHRGESITNAASKDRKFCIQQNSDGLLGLDWCHAYYYQVQTQIFVTDVKYCDFCVCTFNRDATGIHIERIFRDEKFWSNCVDKAQIFFKTCILPELLGRWCTRPSCDIQELLSYRDHRMQQALLLLIKRGNIAIVEVQKKEGWLGVIT